MSSSEEWARIAKHRSASIRLAVTNIFRYRIEKNNLTNHIFIKLSGVVYMSHGYVCVNDFLTKVTGGRRSEMEEW
jgi:hypothetical protein